MALCGATVKQYFCRWRPVTSVPAQQTSITTAPWSAAECRPNRCSKRSSGLRRTRARRLSSHCRRISTGHRAPLAVWRGGQVCALEDLVKTPPRLAGRWADGFRVNERGEILAFRSGSSVGAGHFVLRPRK